MVRKSFMLIAGEPSGDLLGAELVRSLRVRLTEVEGQPSEDLQPLHTGLAPEFYGAGGPEMAVAGVKLVLDMTRHSVVGVWEVLKQYGHFRRVFRQLLQLAIAREPDAIICIDFSGFNLRFAHAIRRYVRSREGTFNNWSPRIIQYVSPQVWASRPRRAERLAQDCDLLLSILPFEKDWYGRHAPNLRVVFTGHPIADRHALARTRPAKTVAGAPPEKAHLATPHLLLLPGSRVAEVKHHLPVMLQALSEIQRAKPALKSAMVLPNERLLQLARLFHIPADLDLQAGNLGGALAGADVAIASTGTVMLECAHFGVPTVALYKTSSINFWIGKRLVQVKFLAMPNLLADEEVYPEFIQDAATSGNLARSALELLDNTARRAAIQSKLSTIVQALGPPGASIRAAEAIVSLLESEPRPLRACLNC
jgi:lipid-A-disaccharide synthase